MFITSIKFSFFFLDMRGSLALSPNEIMYIINISFILDILINFNTGYYEKGTIIKDRRLIFIHYLKGSLFADILV